VQMSHKTENAAIDRFTKHATGVSRTGLNNYQTSGLGEGRGTSAAGPPTVQVAYLIRLAAGRRITCTHLGRGGGMESSSR